MTSDAATLTTKDFISGLRPMGRGELGFGLHFITTNGPLNASVTHFYKEERFELFCSDQDGSWWKLIESPEELRQWVESLASAGAVPPPLAQAA